MRLRVLPIFIVGSSTLAASHGSSFRSVKRQASEIRDVYDFVIIGGGTSGLTVADRLTEAFPESPTDHGHNDEHG